MTQILNPPVGSPSRLRLAVDAEHPDTASKEYVGPHVTAQCDALADLFLGGGCLAPEAPVVLAAQAPVGGIVQKPGGRSEGQESGAPRPLAGRAAPVEALVLGHLPVLASAWMPQYARALAASLARAVALVRFRGGTVAVELFGGSGGGMGGTEADIGAGIASASRDAARWLLSVDATSEPMLADLLHAQEVSSLTLLTGADDAASVACYRTMKALLGDRPDTEGSVPSLRIGLMGATVEVAREAGDRLARAAEAFLGFRPEVFHAGAKIEPAPSRVIYRGQSEAGVQDVLGLISRTRAPGERTEKGASKTSAMVEPPFAQVAPAVVGTETRQATVVAPVAADDQNLVALMPGLRGLAVRCPHARAVQFGVDGDGGVHLLARDTGAGEPPVAALAAAAAWATMNGDLIAAACPGVTSPALTQAAQHLFTSDAKRIRGLLDARLKIHLLVPAPTAPGSAMIAAELN